MAERGENLAMIESLEAKIVRLLGERKQTLALAESSRADTSRIG